MPAENTQDVVSLRLHPNGGEDEDDSYEFTYSETFSVVTSPTHTRRNPFTALADHLYVQVKRTSTYLKDERFFWERRTFFPRRFSMKAATCFSLLSLVFCLQSFDYVGSTTEPCCKFVNNSFVKDVCDVDKDPENLKFYADWMRWFNLSQMFFFLMYSKACLEVDGSKIFLFVIGLMATLASWVGEDAPDNMTLFLASTFQAIACFVEQLQNQDWADFFAFSQKCKNMLWQEFYHLLSCLFLVIIVTVLFRRTILKSFGSGFTTLFVMLAVLLAMLTIVQKSLTLKRRKLSRLIDFGGTLVTVAVTSHYITLMINSIWGNPFERTTFLFERCLCVIVSVIFRNYWWRKQKCSSTLLKSTPEWPPVALEPNILEVKFDNLQEQTPEYESIGKYSQKITGKFGLNRIYLETVGDCYVRHLTRTERSKREYDLAMHLSDAKFNVVQYFISYKENSGSIHHLAIRYFDMRTLDEVLFNTNEVNAKSRPESEKLSNHQKLQYISSAASALRYFHENLQLVHNNFLPSSFVVNPDMKDLKLFGFDNVKLEGEEIGDITRREEIVFRAPETVRLEKKETIKARHAFSADIYGFGTLCYAIIYEVKPYAKYHDRLEKRKNGIIWVRRKVAENYPPFLNFGEKSIYQSLNLIILGCLEKRPRNRSTIRDIIDNL